MFSNFRKSIILSLALLLPLLHIACAERKKEPKQKLTDLHSILELVSKIDVSKYPAASEEILAALEKKPGVEVLTSPKERQYADQITTVLYYDRPAGEVWVAYFGGVAGLQKRHGPIKLSDLR